MRKRTISLFAFTFLLVACKPMEGVDIIDVEGFASSASTASSVASADQAEADTATEREEGDRGEYVDFRSEVIGNGEASVLFFHASWCPTCKIADEKLQEWYAGDGFPLDLYKVDYDADASQELKTRYGVTYQHTFVLIDAQGNALAKFTGPSDTQLQSLLSSRTN